MESTGKRTRWNKDARLDVNRGQAPATCYLRLFLFFFFWLNFFDSHGSKTLFLALN